MIQTNTLHFLTELRENNHKPWFDAHRPVYEIAKQDVLQCIAAFIAASAPADPSIAHLQPKDCLFRINRDVRFSANKDPYKTNFGFWLSKGGRKSNLAGYYCQIEPGGKSFFGGGLYMPMPPDLKKVRQEIAYCTDEFRAIVENDAFQRFFGGVVVEGHTLVKVPAGYEAGHPAEKYLKLKSFFGSRSLADADWSDAQLAGTFAEGVALVAPLVNFLNRSIEE
jgi:uncharacterized protein (TIGR02453 family)